MTAEQPKRLRMFASPNGSGKTSLVRKLAQEFSPEGLFHLPHFINADDIFRDLQASNRINLNIAAATLTEDDVRESFLTAGRLPSDHPFLSAFHVIDNQLTAPTEACDAYVAAAIADFLRDRLLTAGRSFGFETVMSHRSKVEVFARARAAGYRTYLYFVATDSPLVNLNRVGNRAALGGHDVPANKIVERYERSLALVRDALVHAHRAFLFDNSGVELIWLAEQTPKGKLEIKVPRKSLPGWFNTWVVPG